MPTAHALGLTSTLWMAPAIAVLLGCWATLAGITLRSLPSYLRSWKGPEARLRWALLALVVLAVGLRLFWAPATPEIRWRVPFGYYGAFSGGASGIEDIRKYGLGLPLAVRVLVAGFGPSLWLPYLMNAVAGGLCVLPLAGFVRAVGGSDRSALWCGFALALTPMHIWYSHTDGPFPVDSLATLAVFWAVARYGRDPSAVWLVVAVASLLTTVQMRVESVATGPLAVLLALAVWPRSHLRRWGPWVAVAAASLLVVPHVALVIDAALIESGNRVGWSESWAYVLRPSYFIALRPDLQAPMLMVALVFGVVANGVSWQVRAWAVLGLFVTGTMALDAVPAATAFSIVRYQFRTLTFAALLAGLGLSAITSGRWSRWFALPLVGATLASLPMAATVSVMKREQDVVLEQIHKVPSPCTVVTWLSQGDATLYPPAHLSQFAGLDHHWIDLAWHQLPEPDACLVYYRSGSCSCHYQCIGDTEGPMHSACADFEARWELEPIVEVDMPADPNGPMGIVNRFPELPIPVGFYRVVGPKKPPASAPQPDEATPP